MKRNHNSTVKRGSAERGTRTEDPAKRGKHLWLMLLLVAGVFLGAAPATSAQKAPAEKSPKGEVVKEQESPYLLVLGVAQDGGVPQAGTRSRPRWQAPDFRSLATSLAVVDPVGPARLLFDATPDLREQLAMLDRLVPVEASPGLDGIFLTHAHMGHYTGLMFLGFESMGASGVPVFAMPRMAEYLRSNGPWSQLVSYGNIELRVISDRQTVEATPRVRVTPLSVPHRQEFSEVVGFVIQGPRRSVLFIPDIDSWHEWDEIGIRIEDEIAAVDVAYLDGTFFANGEIPGRDMSGFPHPFISHSLERFQDLPASEKQKIRFIHLNHTNPALNPHGDARRQIEAAGFAVAEEGERQDL